MREILQEKNQTLENSIIEKGKRRSSYQREKQALQKNLESVKEKHGNLRMLTENLEAAEKKHQEKIW